MIVRTAPDEDPVRPLESAMIRAEIASDSINRAIVRAGILWAAGDRAAADRGFADAISAAKAYAIEAYSDQPSRTEYICNSLQDVAASRLAAGDRTGGLAAMKEAIHAATRVADVDYGQFLEYIVVADPQADPDVLEALNDTASVMPKHAQVGALADAARRLIDLRRFGEAEQVARQLFRVGRRGQEATFDLLCQLATPSNREPGDWTECFRLATAARTLLDGPLRGVLPNEYAWSEMVAELADLQLEDSWQYSDEYRFQTDGDFEGIPMSASIDLVRVKLLFVRDVRSKDELFKRADEMMVLMKYRSPTTRAEAAAAVARTQYRNALGGNEGEVGIQSARDLFVRTALEASQIGDRRQTYWALSALAEEMVYAGDRAMAFRLLQAGADFHWRAAVALGIDRGLHRPGFDKRGW